jgi:phosphatidylglycerophosphate synthase
MTVLEDFQGLVKSWLFWVIFILSILGVAMAIYLAYKGKDKVASMMIAIPMAMMATIIIGVISTPLLAHLNELLATYLIKPTIHIISFTPVYFILKKVAVPIVKKMFQFQVQKGN